MKMTSALFTTLIVLLSKPAFSIDENRITRIGAAEVSLNTQTNDTGVTILTLLAQVPETNNLLRGLKNTDQRRLSKLGQLTYQCKLMFYQSSKSEAGFNRNDPFLVSKNYSLVTGVDVPLSTNERMGIQVNALKAVDDNSLFNVTLGERETLNTKWEALGNGSAINLSQFDINLLNETDLIEHSESMEIVARFPIFQMEKPVVQWRYHFNLKDFKQAVKHINNNCTPARLKSLIEKQSFG